MSVFVCNGRSQEMSILIIVRRVLSMSSHKNNFMNLCVADVTKRLEYLKGRSELQEIDEFITTRKARLRRTRPMETATRHADHHTDEVAPRPDFRRNLPKISTEVLKPPRPLPSVPPLPTPSDNSDSLDKREESSEISKNGTPLQAREGIPSDSQSRREIIRPDPLPIPPKPCPGLLIREKVEQDPLLIYADPKINSYFKSLLPKRRQTLDLNEVADILPENLLDIENFHMKRAGLFEKFSECHRQSYRSAPVTDIPEVDEIAGYVFTF